MYNGVNFMQVVEGAETAIDDLMRRLLADQRHSKLKIENERLIDQRSFPEWTMKLARISADYLEAQQDLAVELPTQLPLDIRQQIIAMTEGFSNSAVSD